MSKNVQSPTPLQAYARILKTATDSRESLSEFAAQARLTPVAMIDDAVARLDREFVHSINQMHLSMYSALYLSVLGLQNQNKFGITATDILDPVSDRRKVDSWDVIDRLAGVATESADRPFLRTTGSFMADVAASRVALEAKGNDVDKPSSLAVGKVLNVPLGQGLPDMSVTVMLNPRVLDSAFMGKVLDAYVGKPTDLISRWTQWRTGEISSFLDYALCLDMIRQDKQLRLEDKDGFYTAARNSRSSGLLSTLWSGKKSMNIASNFVLLHENTARNLEGNMRGKFSNFKKREDFFKSTGSMICTVVNPTHERITVYTRGIREFGIYDFDEIKAAATNPGHADVNAIMKAYKEGAAFSL
ncbi:capsid protein [Vibrio phage BONAISHI]|nr:capsid protein [Vibrio phage BONAISHI]